MQRKKGDKTQAEILASAKVLYKDRHFSTVTVADVMRGTQHHRNSFYDYFDSLTDFIWIFLDEFETDYLNRPRPWYENEDDLAVNMVRQYRVLIELSVDEGWKLLTARQAAECSKINSAVYNHFETKITDQIRKNLERQVETGAIRSEMDVDTVSKSVFKINLYAATEMVRQDKLDVDYWTKILGEIWLPVIYGVTWESLFSEATP